MSPAAVHDLGLFTSCSY